MLTTGGLDFPVRSGVGSQQGGGQAVYSSLIRNLYRTGMLTNQWATSKRIDSSNFC